MMGSTHALLGMLLGISSLVLWPEHLLFAGIAAFIGGLFPDIDLAFEHRKTLHFPVIYSVVALFTGLYAFLFPSSASVAAFYFIFSAAFHSAVDVFGGGLETRPWIPESDRAVYSHTLKRWFAPKRWIRYDGSPEDLMLSILVGVPSVMVYPEILDKLVFATLGIGAVYTLLRKKIVDWAPERFL